VGPDDPAEATFGAKTERDGPGTGAQVQDVRTRMIPGPGEHSSDEEFRLGPRYQHPRSDAEFQRPKGGGALDVLQRLVPEPSLEARLELGQLLRRQRAVELKIQVETPQSQHSREQELGVQAPIRESTGSQVIAR